MLNEALRLMRVYHDMSKAELARSLGYSRSFITELEAGNKKVTLETINRYSVFFKIPASSIMLFAEHTDHADFSGRAKTFVAEKALKMLDWVATISHTKRDEEA